MLAILGLVFLVGGAPAAVAQKSHKIRPYSAPQLEPEPELTPSDVRVVEIVPPEDDYDANVLVRPAFIAPMVGQVLRGARVAVRGEVQVKNAKGCPAQLYYALQPFGFICANQTRNTNQPPTIEQVLQVPEGSNLPYTYVMVAVEEGTFLPMWKNVDSLRAHEEPERQLKRGDSIAVGPRLEHFEDVSYYVAVDDKVVPVKGTFTLKNFSDWQGVPIDDKTYVTYTNGIYETRNGRKIAYVPQYAQIDGPGEPKVAAMDAAALETYRRLGWEVRPIHVRDAYRFHGTVGCLANVLERRPGR
jgi:hypothetical protein